MTITKELKNAVLDSVMHQIDRSNNGMLSRYKVSASNMLLLYKNNIRVSLDKCIVYNEETNEVIAKIKRKFSSRKTNLCYKELKPTIEYVI